MTLTASSYVAPHKLLVDEGAIDSDHYTMADFVEQDDPDLFAKARSYYAFIEDWKRKKTHFYLRRLLSACRNRVTVLDNLTDRPREMIMMGSNNYLGLSTHPKVIEAGQKALAKYGSGLCGAPHMNGLCDLVRELEVRLARLKSCEDAMVFSTGYSANVGSVSALIRSKDVALMDRWDHASIIDGCRLSGGNFRAFRHNDMGHLETLLQRCRHKFMGKLVVVDGVFSMDGDLAPLPEIVRLARLYGARVLVDDAHATGVLGSHGGGTTDHFHLEGQVDLVMGTFSKSLGCTGGFVAGNKEAVHYIRYYARSYMFSAGITPAVVATALAALQVMEEEPERRKQLWENTRYLHDNLKAMGYTVFPSPPESAILIITIGDNVKLRQMSREIHEGGVFVNAVPYPAVPLEKCCFRFSVMATHTRDDLDRTLDVMRKAGLEHGLLHAA
ncbi:MAG TPA: aminotransferase class I/II-fold pyridoxal phosphate-dependent enzyme [Elusimicrobiota bacterium]|nr:aminotransferase class I/II-fold pyridoxal phosphate-dependent enzyme [Elusimicrobiota bacterium]